MQDASHCRLRQHYVAQTTDPLSMQTLFLQRHTLFSRNDSCMTQRLLVWWSSVLGCCASPSHEAAAAGSGIPACRSTFYCPPDQLPAHTTHQTNIVHLRAKGAIPECPQHHASASCVRRGMHCQTLASSQPPWPSSQRLRPSCQGSTNEQYTLCRASATPVGHR